MLKKKIVRGLDLSPYLIGKGHDNNPTPLYDLYAVVNHYGGILGGHYTSFVRCSDTKDMKKNEVGGYKSNKIKVIILDDLLLLFHRSPLGMQH